MNQKRKKTTCNLYITIILALFPFASLATPKRFFIMGDGQLKIRSLKNRIRFQGRYRTQSGRYIQRALKTVNQVFDGDLHRPEARISLRLIELLSYLRHKFKGDWIILSSGYRSPAYNKRLRKKGRVVARSSLHQYGMACDLRIQRVDSQELWAFVREKRLGGAGYYHNPWIHIDVGPPRSWTQGTAAVRKGVSLYNRRIILVPEYDIYRPNQIFTYRFARMTAYPIEIKNRLILERARGKRWKRVGSIAAGFPKDKKGPCPKFYTITEMLDFSFRIPPRLKQGRYLLRIQFCGKRYPGMPSQISSFVFKVKR